MSPGNSRTKHVDLKMKWLQDHLQKGDIQIHHVPTSINMSEILTKALPRETFVRCIANALNPDDILPPIAQNEGSAERIYDGHSTHTLSMGEYVLIHIIYSLHLYNEGIHTHT
jgi:hypothetical protein